MAERLDPRAGIIHPIGEKPIHLGQAVLLLPLSTYHDHAVEAQYRSGSAQLMLPESTSGEHQAVTVAQATGPLIAYCRAYNRDNTSGMELGLVDNSPVEQPTIFSSVVVPDLSTIGAPREVQKAVTKLTSHCTREGYTFIPRLLTTDTKLNTKVIDETPGPSPANRKEFKPKDPLFRSIYLGITGRTIGDHRKTPEQRYLVASFAAGGAIMRDGDDLHVGRYSKHNLLLERVTSSIRGERTAERAGRMAVALNGLANLGFEKA